MDLTGLALRASAARPRVLLATLPGGTAARLRAERSMLSVAGWPTEATAARRLRDDLLDGAPGASVVPRLDRFARRVGRSRTPAWLTRGIGSVSGARTGTAGRRPAGDTAIPATCRRA
ncbi:hypothetical protein [Streptomyces sp. NPDC047725]|uniref:hypothetical protein n=1 Tax=Streptomyces sp. NPDC047725 TaxID=3365487 RepID=UPI0037160917